MFFKYLLTLGLAENHQLYRFVLVDVFRRSLDFSTPFYYVLCRCGPGFCPQDFPMQ
jgi:hypothetical protein